MSIALWLCPYPQDPEKRVSLRSEFRPTLGTRGPINEQPLGTLGFKCNQPKAFAWHGIC